MSPEIKAVAPEFVVIFPELFTCGAMKATVPPENALMSPKLETEPGLLTSFSKMCLLFRKSVSFMFSELANNAPVSTLAPLPNKTPLAFIKNTCPFDFKLPKI